MQLFTTPCMSERTRVRRMPTKFIKFFTTPFAVTWQGFGDASETLHSWIGGWQPSEIIVSNGWLSQNHCKIIDLDGWAKNHINGDFFGNGSNFSDSIAAQSSSSKNPNESFVKYVVSQKPILNCRKKMFLEKRCILSFLFSDSSMSQKMQFLRLFPMNIANHRSP